MRGTNNIEYNKLKMILPTWVRNKDVFFVCIGTDLVIGDALGPIVGTMLKRRGYKNVIGTLDYPLHARNMVARLSDIPQDKIIIVVDACLGNPGNVGKINIGVGPMNPGKGFGKALPEFGDIRIQGIVNIYTGEADLSLLNVRLSFIMNMAEKIFTLITDAIPLKNKSVDRLSFLFAGLKGGIY